MIASDTSIKAAPEPVKLSKGIGKRGCDVGSRFVVQALCLDQPGTSGRIPEQALKVPSRLGMGCAGSSGRERHFLPRPALGVGCCS
jgi:hypothetical protein